MIRASSFVSLLLALCLAACVSASPAVKSDDLAVRQAAKPEAEMSAEPSVASDHHDMHESPEATHDRDHDMHESPEASHDHDGHDHDGHDHDGHDHDKHESPEPSSEPSNSDDEVCVDHAWVSARFAADDLVHASKPIMADVLCVQGYDSLPCMTRHHMVRVAGHDLSAEELCSRDGVTCTKDHMAVNSVLSHKWTETQHKDVTLTMLDARHPATMQFALHRSIAAARWLGRHSAAARTALLTSTSISA